MFKIVVDDSYFVKLYEQNMFGGGVVHFTDDERNAGKFPEMIAREICSGLREYKKDVMIKRVK